MANKTLAGGWDAFPETIRELSLVFVVDKAKRKVLLGNKKRGVGVGLYNGFGGKPERGETILECAIRELEEESGLSPAESSESGSKGIYRAGHLDLSRPKGDGREYLRIPIFVCLSWSSEPIETEEMIPQWFSLPPAEINEESMRAEGYPFDDMWPEARLFHPLIFHQVFSPTLSSQTGQPRQMVGRLKYDLVNPSSVPPWCLIRRIHSNASTLKQEDGSGEDEQEALTAWEFKWE